MYERIYSKFNDINLFLPIGYLCKYTTWFYNGILGVIVLINFTKNRLYYYFYQGWYHMHFSVTFLSFKDVIIHYQFYANIILSYIPLNNVKLGLRLPREIDWSIVHIYIAPFRKIFWYSISVCFSHVT